MTDSNFKKILSAIGIMNYKVLGKSAILYTSTRSRSDRQSTLEELADLLKTYSAVYVKKSNISSAGHVSVGTKIIALKPEKTSGGIILKPGFFGTSTQRIVDKDIPLKSYFNYLTTAINLTAKLDDLQKQLLFAFVNVTADPSQKNKTELKKYLSYLGQTISINTINNDFGEVLGPLGIVANSLLPIDQKTAQVFIPGRSNEPLLDYKITDTRKEYKISAKAGGGASNTLNPGSVVKLIEGDRDGLYLKKWKKTPQFNIIKLLSENTIKNGPIIVSMWAKHNGFSTYFSWLKNDTYSEEVRQKCENALVDISRNALDFTQLVSDATTAKIYYVKFRATINGETDWKLVETRKDKDNEKMTMKRITLRSKNYIGRAEDKLGFAM
jgi:hypothetical protein